MINKRLIYISYNTFKREYTKGLIMKDDTITTN